MVERSPRPTGIDFAAAWREMLLRRSSPRLERDADLRFWEAYAAHYDARVAVPGSYALTLDALTRLVRAGDSLLDVGAGTGRFTLPLARLVGRATALDQSPAMLAILERKAAEQGLTNVTTVAAPWEEAHVAPHDVVLAAWALYRQVDLRRSLEQLIGATTRTLVIVTGVGGDPPHRAAVEAIFGTWNETEIPAHAYLLGALWELGIWADVRIVWETRRHSGATPEAVAAALAPLNAEPSQVAALAERLTPHLSESAAGCAYAYRHAVGIVSWSR